MPEHAPALAASRAYPLDPPDTQPPLAYPAYRATAKRAPLRPSVVAPHTITELTAPVFEPAQFDPREADLTRRHVGEPLGERIIVTGRVLDGDGDPVSGALVEIWQANAAGRYAHPVDGHDAPLDPNFTGAGRCATGPDGRYAFTTVKPGAYPWANHANAWRPAHVHFSVVGPALVTRLVTQMYFPGDPLLAHDPIFGSVPRRARNRLVSEFDLDVTREAWALGYAFDIVLRGRRATPVVP